MKSSGLVTVIGFCAVVVGCGAADNGATPSEGATWSAPVEVGEAGATSADPGEGNVVELSAEALTLKGWTLQLPNHTEVSSINSDHQPYYYKAADGGRVFMDPASGITTDGSVHPRTELHEDAAWRSTGTNTLTVTGKVLQSSTITVGQVFNDEDKITLAELQYTSGGFRVLYEEEKGNADPPSSLGGSVPVGQKYTFTMAYTKGELKITVNGHTYTHKPSSKVSGNHFYFKVGNYDQKSTKATTVSKTVHSRVEDYSVSVSHS